MARNKDLARLPRNPKISAVLVWEKDKEGKSGRLVFSDIQYEPIIIEVDELKRMHKPLIRIVYYRDGQEVAYAILPKDIGPLNAQNVMGCIDVRLGEVRSYHPAPDVFKMIFYKALAFVKSDNFGVQLQHGNYQSAAAEITLWAENIYKAHGVNHDETAIYDIATGRLSPVRTGSDSLTIDDLRRRFPISYRQVIMTPGSLHGLDTHDTILYCLACKSDIGRSSAAPRKHFGFKNLKPNRAYTTRYASPISPYLTCPLTTWFTSVALTPNLDVKRPSTYVGSSPTYGNRKLRSSNSRKEKPHNGTQY